MRPILECLINPVQSAFIPKRSIHDNILVAHKIMNKFNNMKGKHAYIALKLDMEKAYDIFEWDFVTDELIGYVNVLLPFFYSVIKNDEVCGFICPSRGICQGDLLFLYLFILYMNVLG